MTSPDKAVPTGSFGTHGFAGLTDGRAAAYSNDPNTVQNYTHSTFQAMTNGAVNSLAQRSNASLNTYVGSAIDEMLAGLCRALAGIDILGIEPFAFLNGWANDLDAQARHAVTTASTAQATANSAITTLQTQRQQSSTGGNAVSLPSFPSNLSGSLGPGWNLGGESGTANWATDKNGDAYLAPQSSGAVTGRRYALNQTAMATDDHQVTTVVGWLDSASPTYTGLIVRAAPDMSNFVYFLVFQGSADLGYGTWNSATGTWAFNPWGTTPITLRTGSTITLSASGNTYTGTIDGVGIVAHTDLQGNATVGQSNRSVGLISKQDVDGWGNVKIGWAAGSFNASDTTQPATLGTGWSIFRGSNVSVGYNNSADGYIHPVSNVFDTQRQLANVRLVDLSSGVIEIRKAGWYSVAWACEFAGSFPTEAGAGFLLTPAGGTQTMARVGGLSNGKIVVATASNLIYCQVGDRIQPGIFADGTGSGQLQGYGGGFITYFEGALVSGA